MDKREVREFFNSAAKSWDAELIRDDAIISDILDNAGIGEGMSVLDVACGTGVLIPDYLARNAASVTGIDISERMIEAARAKFTDERVSFICGDAETAELPCDFDAVMIYNAFPHFPDPEGIIHALSNKLRTGGTLTVAHGRSRREIDHHHSGGAKSVSMGLMSAEDLSKLFAPYLNVTVKIDDDRMYQVTGVKK